VLKRCRGSSRLPGASREVRNQSFPGTAFVFDLGEDTERKRTRALSGGLVLTSIIPTSALSVARSLLTDAIEGCLEGCLLGFEMAVVLQAAEA
jgi:hypothetical protein